MIIHLLTKVVHSPSLSFDNRPTQIENISTQTLMFSSSKLVKADGRFVFNAVLSVFVVKSGTLF